MRPQNSCAEKRVIETIAILRGHTYDVHTIAIHPSGRLLASYSMDAICLWDLNRMNKLVNACQNPADIQPLTAAAFAWFGYRLAGLLGKRLVRCRRMLPVQSSDFIMREVADGQRLGNDIEGACAAQGLATVTNHALVVANVAHADQGR